MKVIKMELSGNDGRGQPRLGWQEPAEKDISKV